MLYKPKEHYKEIRLNKIKIFPVNKDLNIHHHGATHYKVFEYKSINIELFDNLESARNFLMEYKESDNDVIAYEIIAPEHAQGEFEYVWNEEADLLEEIFEDEIADESPDFIFIFDNKKKIVSTYFFDKNKPGGERKDEELMKNGDIAYVRASVFQKENYFELLIPVIIEGELSNEYLHDKWRKVIIETEKNIIGIEEPEEPSEESINFQIDRLSNIDKDSIVFKPLATVKCNWGDEPQLPYDDAPRIDFLPLYLIKSIK